MSRPGKKTVYLDSNAVDNLKTLLKEWYYHDWIKLNTMSQLIIALILEHRKYKN